MPALPANDRENNPESGPFECQLRGGADIPKLIASDHKRGYSRRAKRRRFASGLWHFMRTRTASIATAFIWLSALAAPVAAQDFAQQAIQCTRDGRTAPAVAIAACEALLRNRNLQRNQLAAVYNMWAGIHYDQRNFPTAVAGYSEAIRLNSQDHSYYFNRGMAYQQQSDHSNAVVDYSHAIRLNQNIGDYYFYRAESYYRQNELSRAVADYSEMIRRDPQDADAYLARGILFHKQDDFTRAIGDYSEAIRVNPRNAAVYELRALAHDRLGDTARAALDRAEAARLQP